MINLSAHELRLFERILEGLTHNLDSQSIRLNAALDLLQLLNADHYASFVWSTRQKAFVDGLGLNMSEDNLQRYHEYYQFKDPITHQLQAFRRAVSVNEVMEQKELIKTEFYNDFLRIDGLYWGMNLYAYNGLDNIGDMRIWRRKEKGSFSSKELSILNMLRSVFENSLHHSHLHLAHDANFLFSNEALMHKFQLTPREAEITRAVFEGKMDERIAADLNISFSTVRTHLKNIYRKLAVCNRASLVNLVLAHQQT